MELIGKVVKRLVSLKSVLVMQALLILSFQAFGLQSVYALIGLACALGVALVYWRRMDDHQKTDIGLLLSSITIFVLFLAISPLYLESGSLVRNTLVALGFPAFYFLGFAFIHLLKIPFAQMIKVMVIGLSIFVLVNVLATLYAYLPLYRVLYAGQVIYVDGEMYQVANEMKWLIGLRFVEVNMVYAEGYLTLLWLPLFANGSAIKEWRQWRKHGWWLLSSFTALLATLLLPTFLPVLYASLIYLGWLALIHVPTFAKRFPSVFSVVRIGLFSLVGMMVGLFFIEGLNLFGLATVIKSIRPLALILDFPMIEKYQAVLRTVGQFPFGGFAPIIVGNQNFVTTHSLVFDTLHQGGIFAFAGLVLTGVLFIFQLIHFHQDQRQDRPMVTTFILMVVAFMVGQTFATTLYPYVRETLEWMPRLILDEPLWALMFLWMGMIMVDPFKGWLSAKQPLKPIATKSNPVTKTRKRTTRSSSRLKRTGRDR